MIVCLNWVYINARVLREGKWKVTQDQYNFEKYPNYCAGAGIAFSRQGTDKSHYISIHPSVYDLVI